MYFLIDTLMHIMVVIVAFYKFIKFRNKVNRWFNHFNIQYIHTNLL